MPEYIDRDELLKELCTVSAPTPSESWIVEKCIEKVNEQPTADVVPKSEVDKTIAEWAYLHADVLNKLENARAEVAREIFAEIEEHMVVFGDINLSTYFRGIGWKVFAELKKKYT